MFAAEATAPRGSPSVETTRWYLVPRLPRSVGFGPVNSPPCLARTLQLSTITSNSRAAVSGSERAMRSSTAWTRGSTAVSRQSRNRRRRVEPDARPAAAGSSRHWTPSRRKNRKVSTTSATGRRGRPRSAGSPSSRSMISATRLLAVTLKVHSNAIQRPYMAARHLDLHNGQHGCYVQTLDLPIIGNRLLVQPAVAWSAVISMALCVAVLIASEFMPVSLLTPIADELALTEGQV